MAAGEISPDEAEAAASVVEMKRRAIETLELERRVQAELRRAEIIVDPQERQTAECHKAAWLGANPDAAGREIFREVWIIVDPNAFPAK